MLHTRFPKLAETPVRSQFTFDHTLQRLVDEQLADVTVEKDIAYLSLRKAADRIEKREAVVAVDEFIAGLERAGVSAGEACHYCGSPDDVQTIFNGHRVGQICGGCTRQQAVALMDERRFDRRCLSKLLLTGGEVLPLMTAAWAGLWIAISWLLSSQGGSMNIPVKIGLLVALFLGVAAGTPALLFRRVRNRGDVQAGVVGAVCAVLAFGIGEIAIATFHVWRSFGVLNVRVGAAIALPLLTAGNGLFLLLRGAALISFVGSAFGFAKPPAAKLDL
jgi:hypothetical protein